MKTAIEPPAWGRYAGAAEFYRSEEWLRIVRASLKDHRRDHRHALAAGDLEAAAFYSDQINACRRELHGEEDQPNARNHRKSRSRSIRSRL